MAFEYSMNGSIGIITLNNAPGNRLTSLMMGTLNELDEFLRQPSLTGAIFQGAGTNFCEGIAVSDNAAINSEQCEKLLTIISQVTVPTVAAIQGKCLDAGFEIACCCHFHFATSDVQLGLSDACSHTAIHSGIIPLLSHSITRSRVISLLLSGKIITGSEAVQLGIIDALVSSDSLFTHAQRHIQTLTHNRSPHLIRTVMQAINNSFNYPTHTALHEESILFDQLVRGNRTHIKE